MESSLIDRYIKTVIYASASPPKAAPPPVVAIHRDFGAGARTIAPYLAKRLGVPLYDQAILEGIIQRLRGQPELLRRLDESAPPGFSAHILHILTGQPSIDEYARTLVDVVLGITRTGGIIVGRGAHLIASASGIFRVYLRASPEICVERIAARTGKDLIWAQHERNRVAHERRRFLTRLFGKTMDDCADFDLLINTDAIDPLEKAVDIIITALRVNGRIDEARAR